MKPKRLTIVKHGNMYVEDMRCSFCPECSELNIEYTAKDTELRGAGPIKYAVKSYKYKYECKNCGCVWSEDDVVKRQVSVSDDVIEFFKMLLGIFLACAAIAINVIVIGAAVYFIENLLG